MKRLYVSVHEGSVNASWGDDDLDVPSDANAPLHHTKNNNTNNYQYGAILVGRLLLNRPKVPMSINTSSTVQISETDLLPSEDLLLLLGLREWAKETNSQHWTANSRPPLAPEKKPAAQPLRKKRKSAAASRTEETDIDMKELVVEACQNLLQT